MITDDMIDEIADEYPLGKEDPSFKREFLLISEADFDTMVVPEFDKQVKQVQTQQGLAQYNYLCRKIPKLP